MNDARRRQYVPVSVNVAHSRTGHRLLERFGPNGLLVWILVLCAAKRALNQGEFEYVSEADGWERLGLAGFAVSFTLKEFFDYTGRMHNTRRIDQKTIQIRAWNEWNSSIRREQEVARKRRKRAQNGAPVGRTEVDLDSEIRKERAEIEKRKAENLAVAEQFLSDLKDKL